MIIRNSITFWTDPEDLREYWWGRAENGKDVMVVVSAGASDAMSYGGIVTAYEEDKPSWWFT
jgi:hypothetical protein